MDFAIFKNIGDDDKCNGTLYKECKAVDRIIAALEYYEHLVLSPFAANYGDDPRLVFDSFCRDRYPKKVLLNDYIHWVLNHNDSEALMLMRKRLHFLCESAKHCGATTRHYRDRRNDANEADSVDASWYTDKMDCIHFNVRHLHEVGLRLSAETLQPQSGPDDTKENDSYSKNAALQRMTKELKTKRAVFSNQRLNSAKNAKFTMQIATLKDIQGMWSFHFVFCKSSCYFLSKRCSLSLIIRRQ